MEEPSLSSNDTPGRSRGDARISMAEKWANFRKLQAEQPKKSMRSPPEPKAFPFPPLCVLLKRSWNQTMMGLVHHKEAPKKQGLPIAKRDPFPSVLSVLKANAVKVQVESMLEEETKAQEDVAPDRLSVLPANYDFTTSAVTHMSETRSRAFLLLDFSAIVQTHTIWRKRLQTTCKGHKTTGKMIQMVYSARHNCNPRLIQLFQRLGVGLRVTTKYDLAAVRRALLVQPKAEDPNRTPTIWDDTSVLVKPNSFYRNLLFQSRPSVAEEHHVANERRIPITVNDADEMQRIHQQLSKIWKRRHGSAEVHMPRLDFVLKLESSAEDIISKWKFRLSEMQQRASKLPQTQVVGFALELEDKGGPMQSGLLLDALSALLENWKASPPQVHLTNPITSTAIESEVVEWIQSHRKLCSTITIDVSRLLIANAAALCARIIGVKNTDLQKDAPNTEQDKTEDDIAIESLAAANSNHAIQQHLYIDDGCYGSLSNYPNEGTPLPLKSQRLDRTLSLHSKEMLDGEQGTLVKTTVWGPTCDGLDKVCSNVALPRLSRDDWLVFADLGFCNEGTCFNGFSPPDIACCVLGGNL